MQFRTPGEGEGRKMLRTIKIGAIVALTSVVGNHASGTGTLTWGIFRENATNVPESQRNCWTQAMVSGSTINGELMAQRLTETKAQTDLQRLAQQGQCAAERTSTTWSARGRERNEADGSSSGASAGNGSRRSDRSDDDRSDDNGDRSDDHADRDDGPTSRR
jgi:hypothetical protein